MCSGWWGGRRRRGRGEGGIRRWRVPLAQCGYFSKPLKPGTALPPTPFVKYASSGSTQMFSCMHFQFPTMWCCLCVPHEPIKDSSDTMPPTAGTRLRMAKTEKTVKTQSLKNKIRNIQRFLNKPVRLRCTVHSGMTRPRQ